MANTVLFTRELYDAAADFACEFNEFVAPERVVSGSPAAPSDATGDRPGDDFNRRARWEDVLEPHGWRKCRTSGGVTYWTRPGKDPRLGCSATTGKCSTEASGDLLYNFSGSSDKMDAHTCYAKFAAYTLLEHGGDYSAAARKLREQGYGGDGDGAGVHIGDYAPPPDGPDAPPPGDRAAGRRWKYKLASELTDHVEATEWLWRGYIPQRGMTLMSALWKVGKTTLLSHMVKAFGEGGELLGLAIKPCKVLYVTEEMERHWSRRRQELGLTDAASFYIRPFQTKPKSHEWAAFIKEVVADVVADGFELVVFDTLVDLWPVVKENDASEVQVAMKELQRINEAGAAVLLIHHMRKGGGTEHTGARGSGVLGSLPDILIEMTRVEATGGGPDNRRKLTAISRYDEETVREMTIAWNRGVGFERVDWNAPPEFGPTPEQEVTRIREERVLAVLSDDSEDGMSQGEIDKAMKEQFGEGLGRKERWDSYLIPMLTDRRISLVRDVKTRRYYRTENVSRSPGSDPTENDGDGTGNP